MCLIKFLFNSCRKGVKLHIHSELTHVILKCYQLNSHTLFHLALFSVLPWIRPVSHTFPIWLSTGCPGNLRQIKYHNVCSPFVQNSYFHHKALTWDYFGTLSLMPSVLEDYWDCVCILEHQTLFSGFKIWKMQYCGFFSASFWFIRLQMVTHGVPCKAALDLTL